MIRADVLIVGGGPAGATCAWALRRRGYDVLILDHADFPRPKLCAGWITPEVLRDLEVDIEDYPHDLTAVKWLRLSVRGWRIRLPTNQLAIRRIEFDEWLLHRSGARVVQHHVRDIDRAEGGYVVDGEFFGRYLVGAGGTHCPVARSYFAEINKRTPDTLIVTQEEEFRYPYRHDGRGNACHLWFFEHGLPGYAWYVPKSKGIVNVGVGAKAATLKQRGDNIHRQWDHLITALTDQGLVRDHDFHPKGHVYYLNNGRRQLQIDNAFIVGDAAGLATQDMGEGIAPAVRSGLLVAEAVAAGGEIDVRRIHRWSQPPLIAQLLARGYV